MRIRIVMITMMITILTTWLFIRIQHVKGFVKLLGENIYSKPYPSVYHSKMAQVTRETSGCKSPSGRTLEVRTLAKQRVMDNPGGGTVACARSSR